MNPIAERTLAEQAYARIADEIFDGSIGPGSPLVMDELAERLGISRTPVRDALRRLERDGMILRAGGRGYVTVTADPEYRRHIFEARTAVEGFAARLAAVRGATARRSIDLAIDEAVAHPLDTPRGSYEANRLVHRAVVEVTENPILLSTFDHVWGRGLSHHLYANGFRFDVDVDAFRRAHVPLAIAIGSGDGDIAQAAMLAHLADGRSLGPA